MPAPTTPILTRFVQADGPPANFSQAVDSYSVPNVVSNELDWPQFPSAYYNVTQYDNNCEAFTKLKLAGAVSLLLRWNNPNTARESGYVIRANPGDPNLSSEAFRTTVGFGSSISLGFANFSWPGATYLHAWARMIGSDLELYGSVDGITWTLAQAWRDSAITGNGYIGLFDQNAGPVVNERVQLFGGGSIATASALMPPTLYTSGRGAM